MAIFSAIAAGVGLITNVAQAIGAGSRAKAARRDQIAAERKLANLEANRQQIIDPTAEIQDLSSMITNPFANLQVATGAAEFAREQQDLSLASTLDTLRATGAGAGGATALAQAATRGRQQIAADIQRQEAANARMRAQGEQTAQSLRLREAQRVQSARASGREFMFRTREAREMQQLDRAATAISAAQSQNVAARANAAAFSSQALGSLASFGTSLDALNEESTATGNTDV